MIAQLEFPMPAPRRAEPDYPSEARRELNVALQKARGAADEPPWPHRDQRMWRIVFPQMAGWLPADEREPLVAEFLAELDRIEPMFGAVS